MRVRVRGRVRVRVRGRVEVEFDDGASVFDSFSGSEHVVVVLDVVCGGGVCGVVSVVAVVVCVGLCIHHL